MKNPLKWLFTHEPALIAGVAAAVSLFLGLRYGASASANTQAGWPAALLGGFGWLRNFVTSPATKTALANTPSQIAPLADDVGLLSSFVGQAIHHPQGLLGLFDAHWAQIELALKDAEKRILSVVHPEPVKLVTDPPATGTDLAEVRVTPAAAEPPVPEPGVPATEPDHVAELAKLIGQ